MVLLLLFNVQDCEGELSSLNFEIYSHASWMIFLPVGMFSLRWNSIRSISLILSIFLILFVK